MRWPGTSGQSCHSYRRRTVQNGTACRSSLLDDHAIEPRSVVNNDVQERGMNLQSAVVLDEAELAELVHEEVDARARRPDARREDILVDDRNDGFQLSLLAEVGEQQQE